MKIYLESYGCTLNHGEARFLLRLVSSAGHVRVSQPEFSDVLVLFTCTVIHTTELKMLRQLSKWSSLGKPVVVTGCMAVVQREQVLKVTDNVQFLEPKEIVKINELLDELVEPAIEEEPLPVQAELKPDLSPPGSGTAKHTIDSIVPISTGCRGQCTYCITRLARGDLASYSRDDILGKIETALAAGHYEIKLTAQDTACYGYDAHGNLAELLTNITKLESPHEFRVRVGMMNVDSVKPILEDLINAYSSPRVFKFLHLPVQSGDDGLLRAMNRNYTIADFKDIIMKFRGEFPNLTLSTDIIVGYPLETDEQFNTSLELVKKVQPNIVNITRFSSRPGTDAAKLKPLPGSLVKSRSRELTKLRFQVSKELNLRELGKEYEVLVTEQIKSGTVLARTDSYLPVVIKRIIDLGKFVHVKITDAADSYLIAEVMM